MSFTVNMPRELKESKSATSRPLFQSIPISLLSYAMPHPAPKLRLSNHRGHFRGAGGGGGRLRVSESRRMVKQHGHNPKSPVVVRKYTPLEQNLKGNEKASRAI